jgi:fluoroacetyl-CoA thioesterase
VRPIPEGYEARLGVVVTDDMTVDFQELGRIHPVYATYWMAKHMEEAGRMIIVPFLERADEGVGSAVTVRHRAVALPGMRLEVVARHTKTEGNRVHVECEVTSELGDVIGTGSTEQVILPAESVERRFADVRRRFDDHRGLSP